MKYAFIEAHRRERRIQTICRVLGAARNGFYAWLHRPLADRARQDRRLLEPIRASWFERGDVYGSPRAWGDLRESGPPCSKKRIAPVMREHMIRAIRDYKRPCYRPGRPAALARNRSQQQFTVSRTDEAWVTDITYLRAWQGWPYLAVVIDVYWRRAVRWSMKSSPHRKLVLDALLMAVCQRNPLQHVIAHSDEGTQYGSDEWQRFCRAHRLTTSIGRRANRYDKAVAKSFFSSLKTERIRRKIYRTRAKARADVFDHIEVFYNRKRRHSHIGDMSPAAFEAVPSKPSPVSTEAGLVQATSILRFKPACG